MHPASFSVTRRKAFKKRGENRCVISRMQQLLSAQCWELSIFAYVIDPFVMSNRRETKRAALLAVRGSLAIKRTLFMQLFFPSSDSFPMTLNETGGGFCIERALPLRVVKLRAHLNMSKQRTRDGCRGFFTRCTVPCRPLSSIWSAVVKRSAHAAHAGVKKRSLLFWGLLPPASVCRAV